MFLSIAFICDKIQDTPPPQLYLEEIQVEGFMFSVTQEQECSVFGHQGLGNLLHENLSNSAKQGVDKKTSFPDSGEFFTQ